MLYERWRQISTERRNDLALRDRASGKSWTFSELFVAGEKQQPASLGPIFPQGQTPEFVFNLLAAWREQRIACPLEAGQGGAGILTRQVISSHVPPIVHLKTTSATGGSARFVAFTAGQLMADAENIVITMGLRPDWPNLGVISLAHSYGFSNLVLPLLLHGIPLILAPAPLPEIIRHAAENEAGITLPAVPAMWRAWHSSGAIPHNVRLAISAGAPLPLNLEQGIFDAHGIKVHNFLGSSECGGIAYDASAAPRTDATLAGSPMNNVAVALNEAGCLVVRSQAVGETYWPDKSAALGDGLFQTNDLADLKDGAVFLRGRLGDQINVAGRKVSPETVERALLAHPQVRECLVFGMPSRDAERTEIIVAVIVSNATETDLKQFLLQSLPAWQVPREWHFIASVATNARGKISRAEWRQRLSLERGVHAG